MEDNGCFRDRNEGEDDECEHAFCHPCDDCPFKNITKCDDCSNEFETHPDSPADVCPNCIKE